MVPSDQCQCQYRLYVFVINANDYNQHDDDDDTDIFHTEKHNFLFQLKISNMFDKILD